MRAVLLKIVLPAGYPEQSIFNSLQFLKHISITTDECLVPFDEVTLSTSISLELACETIIHILSDFDLDLPQLQRSIGWVIAYPATSIPSVVSTSRSRER